MKLGFKGPEKIFCQSAWKHKLRLFWLFHMRDFCIVFLCALVTHEVGGAQLVKHNVTTFESKSNDSCVVVCQHCQSNLITHTHAHMQ